MPDPLDYERPIERSWDDPAAPWTIADIGCVAVFAAGFLLFFGSLAVAIILRVFLWK